MNIVTEKNMNVILTGAKMKETLLKKAKQHKIVTLFLALIVVFFFFPVRYSVSFQNGQGVSIEGRIDGQVGIWNSDAEGENVTVWLPRGKQTLVFSSPYRVQVEETRRTWWNPVPVRRVVQLRPDTFTYENATFKDVLGAEWNPEIKVRGSNIDGKPIQFEGDRFSEIPFGTYNLTFQKKWISNETIFSPGDLTNQTMLLIPNNESVILSKREVDWVENFMRDYLEFSSTGLLQSPGYPKQFHIASKNATLTLGDMLFVLCQEEKGSQIIFVPKTNKTTYTKI